MLQWFKNISQRTPFARSQQVEREVTAEAVGSDPSNATQPLNDRDYEFLFTQLLEGVSHGWQPVRIQRFFAALEERGTVEQWIEWLQRYGAKILTSSAPNTTLARRMVALGELTQDLPILQQLGETASGIGRLLLARARPDDADTWQYEQSQLTQQTAVASPPITPEPTTNTVATASEPASAPTLPVNSSPAQSLETPSLTTSAVSANSLGIVGATPLSLTLPNAGEAEQQTITLDELMVRLQEDELLVQQIAQRLGIETRDPHVIIQKLVQQINQRHADAAAPETAEETALPLPSTGGEAESAFNLGVQQYETGDYAGAIAFWDQAIELKPDYYQAWGNRGLGLKNLKQHQAALESYDQALKIAPDFYKAWYNRGLVLDELQQYAEAIAAYDRVIEIKPDFPKAWYSKGLSLEQLGDATNAIKAYDRAVAVKADFQKAWLNRGNCHRRLEQPEAALADYEQALVLKTDDLEALRQRSEVLIELQRYQEAADSYGQALAQKPDDVALHQGRGQALAQLGAVGLALEDYEQILMQQPDAVNVWLAKAQLLHQLGWEQAAADVYKVVEQKEPTLPEVWQWQGKLYHQRREYDTALAYCDRTLKQQNDNTTVWADRGQNLLALGRFEEAIASFDRALQLDPLQWPVWRDRAQAATHSEQADLLLSALSGPAQQEPSLNQRGRSGQISTLQHALKTFDSQHYPEAWGQLQYHLGQVYFQAGYQSATNVEQLQHARTIYQQAQEALTLETAPKAYLSLLTAQMQTELTLEEPQQAKTIHQQAQKDLEALLGVPTIPLTQKREFALQMAVMHQLRVDASLQLGELVGALEWAEYSRNYTFAWLWERLPLQEGSPKWSAMQQRLDDQTAIVYWQLSPLALTTFLITRKAAEPLVLGRIPNVVLNVVLSPALRARVESAKQNSEASLGLLLELLGLNEAENQPAASVQTPTPPESAAEDEATAHQRFQDLTTWLAQWHPLSQDEAQLQVQLPEQLGQLRQLLKIEAIVTTLESKGINNLILIPHQGLHETPIQALFPDVFTVTSLPSLRLAQPSALASQSPRPMLDDPWLKPTNPLEDEEDWFSLGLGESAPKPTPNPTPRSLLCWSGTPDQSPGWETQLMMQELGKPESTAPTQANFAELTQALAVDAAYVHWQPTITVNPTTPQQSQLQAIAEQRVTVNDLTTLTLNHCELWSLDQPEGCSLCYPPTTPEMVSGTVALLSQGVTYVLRPLWRVEQPAHQLFMVEFYHRLAKGSSAIVAHKQAQIWLRTITTGELINWYQSRIRVMQQHPSNCARELEALVQTIQDDPIQALNQDDTPYAHPYYWAGYVIVGYPL
ncbi:MAG: tetratricopeptide repeat protein [Spirulina sp. SIO3F2]|nr:tetratricopeptide repeat protein [Spirulina sp. SIO3F2]